MEKYKITYFALVLFLCSTVSIYGQDSLKSISGKIIDFKTKEPVGFVIVQVLFEGSATQSRNNGTFKINYRSKEPIIVIRKLGYETLTINIDSTVKLPLLVNLKAQSKDLSEVVVSANKPTKRLVDNAFYVADYQLINNQILLLGDINEIPYLRLITKDGEALHTTKLKQQPYTTLFKDCFGNVHVLSTLSSTQVYIADNKIGLLADIRLSLFDSLLRPCILAKEDNFYFETCHNKGQTKQVFAIHKATRKVYDYGTYSNEAMIAMIIEEEGRSQAKYGSSGKNEMEDVSPEELRAMRRKEDERNFFYTIIATKAYIPVFADNDTVFIFDHPNNLIHSYLLETNKPLQVKTMEYNHFKQWKPLVLFDEARDVFYTTYLRDGIVTLGEINRTTGKINKRFKLSHTFPKNIKIDNGIVYYMYRLKFTDDKMALYAHQLE
jgi:hypothetical protein